MRILELNAYYNYGSTGNIVKGLYEEGDKKGYEMYVIYWLLRDKMYESNRVFYCGEDTNPSKVKKISQWILVGGKLNYNTKRTVRIIECIKKIKPDIIHLHNLHGDFEYGSLDIELLFNTLSSLRIKVIWTLHDCWPITGRCYHFSYKKCELWKYGCGNCPQRIFDREGIFRDFSRENWKSKYSLYNGVRNLTVVTVSKWLEDVVKESMLKNRRVVTIYNGIDTKIFKPSKLIKTKDKFTILCIGWDRRKGYRDYFSLAKLLHDDEEILIVGMRPLFRRHNILLSNMREINRATSRAEMASIYQYADVYFNASLGETFGLTTVEAISSGTPVVGYRNTATAELIEKLGGNNKLADDGVIDSVRSKIDEIKRVETNKDLLHNRCCQMFDWSKMLDEYMNLYSEDLSV